MGTWRKRAVLTVGMIQRGGGEHEMGVDQDGVLVRRRKTRKDKGVAKTHGKYVQSGGGRGKMGR